MSVTSCIPLASWEGYETLSHAGSSQFFELRKTQVPKAQNLGTIYTDSWRVYVSKVAKLWYF
jgi:hypothetical protein